MTLTEHYFWHLVEPYLHGRLGAEPVASTEAARQALVDRAHSAGLKLHFLKRLANPRMTRAIGMVMAAWPASLADLGSGKGYLLWHLTECLPQCRAVGIDRSPARAARLAEVWRAAGLTHCGALAGDAERLPLANGAVEAVTLFEVLEHLAKPQRALDEAARVTERYVLASVPSQPDNSPEHLRLFTRDQLQQLFAQAGLKVRIEQDAAHFYAFGWKS